MVIIKRSDTDTSPHYTHSRDSGSVPTTIGALVALTHLDLSRTSIEGTLKFKDDYKTLIPNDVFSRMVSSA
jgi:hypothetical protein